MMIQILEKFYNQLDLYLVVPYLFFFNVVKKSGIDLKGNVHAYIIFIHFKLKKMDFSQQESYKLFNYIKKQLLIQIV